MYHTHLEGKGVRDLAMLARAGPPQEQSPEAESSGETAGANPPPALSDSVEPQVQQGECPYGNGYESAQLCQEWRSATATEEAADLAATANTIDGIVAIFTVLGFLALIWTLYLTRKQLSVVETDRNEARKEAAKLASDTASALAQARRSADAMGDVATRFEASLKISSQIADAQKMAMRAFVTVTIEDAWFQDREQGIKFYARPMIKNNGHTSAKNLRWAATAGILPDPPSDGFKFEFPEPEGRGGFIPPQDGRSIIASLEEFIEDQRVSTVLSSGGESFFVWGKIFYEDVFGGRRETKFGARVFWVSDNGKTRVETVYLPGMNDAT